MSRKERDRLTIMAGVKQQELTLVQAAELMAVELPAKQTHLAAVSGRWRRGPGASAARQTQRAAQAARTAGAGAGSL